MLSDDFRELDLEHTPFAFLDVETTGLDPQQGHRVCEIGLVRTVGRIETRRLHSLINPGRRLSAGAQAVNGISEAMLAHAPRFHQIVHDVLAMLDQTVIVAHNAPFDLGFVNQELRLAWQPQLRNPVVDTLAIARRAYRFPRNGLSELTAYLHLPHADRHRALGDALGMKNLFTWFMDDLRDRGVRTLGDLLAVQAGQGPGQTVGMDGGLLLDLQAAIDQGRRIYIAYRSNRGEVSRRWVDPLRLDDRNGRWYLVGYCHLRLAERSFRIDGILELYFDEP